MHNFQIGLTKNNQVQLAQQRVLERDVSSDAYWYPVPIMDMNDASRAIPAIFYTGAALSSILPPYWEIVETGISGVQFYVPRKPSWINGQVFLEVHITTDDASGGDIMWEISCGRILQGSVLPARSFSTITKDAPLAADTMHVRTITSTTGTAGWFNVNSSHTGMVFTLGRRPLSVADTHTGDVRLHKVICKYRESGREQGGAFNSNVWNVS